MFRYALLRPRRRPAKVRTAVPRRRRRPGVDIDGSCEVRENPDFHVPRTNTGVGDFPGGDVIVTLGAFDDVDGKPVGTPFMQASTLMHELRAQLRATARRRRARTELQADLPERDELPLPVARAARRRGQAAPGFLPRRFSPAQRSTRRHCSTGRLSVLPYRIGWYAPGRPVTSTALGAPRPRNTATARRILPTDPRWCASTRGFAASARSTGTRTAMRSKRGSRQDINFNGASTARRTVSAVRTTGPTSS